VHARIRSPILCENIKILSDGSAPIYARITIDEKRIEMASKRTIDPKKWNAISQKAEGKSEDIRSMYA